MFQLGMSNSIVIIIGVIALLAAVLAPFLPTAGHKFKISVLSVCAVIVLGAVAVLLLGRGTPPSPSPTAAAQATISAPVQMGPGSPVLVTGTVSGLESGKLWIFDQPADNPGKYIFSSDSPVTDRDGDWRIFNQGVGDESDIGSSVAFVAVVANEQCNRELLATAKAIATQEVSVQPLPAGCVEIERQDVLIVG